MSKKETSQQYFNNVLSVHAWRQQSPTNVLLNSKENNNKFCKCQRRCLIETYVHNPWLITYVWMDHRRQSFVVFDKWNLRTIVVFSLTIVLLDHKPYQACALALVRRVWYSLVYVLMHWVVFDWWHSFRMLRKWIRLLRNTAWGTMIEACYWSLSQIIILVNIWVKFIFTIVNLIRDSKHCFYTRPHRTRLVLLTSWKLSNCPSLSSFLKRKLYRRGYTQGKAKQTNLNVCIEIKN